MKGVRTTLACILFAVVGGPAGLAQALTLAVCGAADEIKTVQSAKQSRVRTITHSVLLI
jgi:hypothetical protein